MIKHWISCRHASQISPLPKLIGLLSLLPLWLAACASAPDLAPAAVPPAFSLPAGAPSPTPFQPIGAAFLPTATMPQPAIVTPAATASLSLNLIVDINPLTGLPPANPGLLERRPLAIKISNYPREIRPQYGLNLADQVFEYYIEWQNTRFIGIFYGNDSKQVGPVRSGRFFDEHVARMYHAFLVFNYADPREWNYLKETDIAPYLVIPSCVNGVLCPPFFVSNAADLAEPEHFTNYFDTTRFNEFAAKLGVNNSRQPIRNGFFSELAPVSNEKVNRIYTFYSNEDYNYWQYDSQSRSYLRFEEMKAANPEAGLAETYAPLLDAATSQQVNAQNVVVLFVSHTFANPFNAADEVYHINLLDTGAAYVFRDGVALPARWVRPQKDQPLILTDLNGDPIFLRPGRTFYQVIGMTSTSFQDANGWHFVFKTP